MRTSMWIASIGWVWSGLMTAAGIVLLLIPGWTLLHCYPCLAVFTLLVWYLSYGLVPIILGFGVWQAAARRLGIGRFLPWFLIPQAVGAAFLTAALLVEDRQCR